MRAFLGGFTAYYRAPWPYLRRHLAASGGIALLHFLFFLACISLFGRLFESLWVEDLFRRIGEESLLHAPLVFLNELAGSPLAVVFRPLVLYLAYSAALALTGLFAGPINSALSRRVEAETGIGPPPPEPRSGLAAFLWTTREELVIFSWSVVWSAVLFALTLLPGAGRGLSGALFLLGTPLIHGLFNLSHALQRRGIPYAGIAALAARAPGRFYGFAWASSSGFFVILFLLDRLPYAEGSFALLFALNALFRPGGVVAGTLEATRLCKENTPRQTKSPAQRGLETVVALLAVLTLFSWGEFFSQTGAKAGLVECRYSIRRLSLNLPEAGGPTLARALSLSAFAAAPRLTLELEVENTSRDPVALEDAELELSYGGRTVGRAQLSGIRLGPGERGAIGLALELDTARLAGRLLRELVTADTGAFRLRARILLRFWFGTVAYPLTLAG